MDIIQLRPIGHVKSSRIEPEDDNWLSETAVITLDAYQFGEDALYGLEAFSHLHVIYHFHKVPEDKIVSGARHPRGNTAFPQVDIFVQRAKNRPNRIGLTTCHIIRVDGLNIHVTHLDAIDGTPVLDIKPCMREFDMLEEIRQPEWSTDIMRTYW